ncbi:hypothetical protein [Phascolarctobacterium succinatutens]|uniref:hypothetical protein n=1 Tax=Phascolarctobacterium succinatutens TaxID=626940 RepID=UPI003AB46051
MNATERQKIKCQSGSFEKCVAELHSCYFAENAILKRLAKNVVKKKGKRTHKYCPCCNDELEYIDCHYKLCPNCEQKLLWNNDGKKKNNNN